MHRRLAGCLLVISYLGLGSLVCRAYQAPEIKSPNKPQTGNGKTGDAKDTKLVEVTIATARPNVTTDRDYSIYADIKNISEFLLQIEHDDLTLAVMPEATANQKCIVGIYAYLPTEAPPDDKDKSDTKTNVIKIQPGEHYSVFWKPDRHSSTCEGSDAKIGYWLNLWRVLTFCHDSGEGPLDRIWDAVTFVPGEYKYIVDGKAYLIKDEKAESDYHTFTQSVSLNVGISQTVAIIAAALGGVLGLIVVFLRGGLDQRVQAANTGTRNVLPAMDDNKTKNFRSSPLWRVLIGLRRIASAGLTSAVIAIVASRVSETQLPIKVSVSDFWGSVTLGFVAYFAGDRILQKFSDFAKATNRQSSSSSSSRAGDAKTQDGQGSEKK